MIQSESIMNTKSEESKRKRIGSEKKIKKKVRCRKKKRRQKPEE